MTPEPTTRVQELLGQSDWITRLSRVLVADPATADDIAQDTWADLIARPPRGVGDLRSWLATIVRRKASRLRRGDARRDRRERSAARPEAVPSTAELTSRVELHRELTDAVLALEEPYREAIVLRFFENLAVPEIAARAGVPLNTARSRLQRGMQRLRERLDAEHGGRERWLPGVGVLAARELAPGAAVAGLAGGLLWTTTMKAVLALGAAMAAGLVVTLFATRSRGSEDAIAARPSASEAAVRVADREPSVAASPTSGERVALAPPSAPTPASRPDLRRVVGLDGTPLAGVTVRAESPFAVRWQGGDVGWISGRDGSTRILPAEEQRLRSDPAAAEKFFARFAHPDEWRATVLGSPLPTREVVTAADGTFTFAKGVEVRDEAIAIVDPNHVLVRAGATGAAPWIAGPATRVVGRAVDPQRKPVPDCFVTVHAISESGARELEGFLPVRGDDDGSFLVRRGLAGGILGVTRDGYESTFLPLAETATQTVEVVLVPRAAQDLVRVDGTVVDGGGRIVAGAAVWFGREKTTSGADGRFRFGVAEPKPEQALTVLAKGRALWQKDRFGAELVANRSAGRDLLVVLHAVPGALGGVVLDGNGVPLAGAQVGIVDPTLLDISFEGVEARVGGWSGGVKTSANGAFEIPGLSERSYRLRAIDPATGLVSTSAPLRSPNQNVILRLPAPARRDVRGKVTLGGKPLAEGTVEIGWCTHVTKGGGNQFDSTPPVGLDGEGRFVLRALPPAQAWLVVRQSSAIVDMIPVEALARSGEDLVVACSEQRWLQLVAGEQLRERAIAFQLRDGRVVAAGANAKIARDGAAPVLAIPDAAVAVVLDHGTPHERRMELTDDRAVHLRVR